MTQGGEMGGASLIFGMPGRVWAIGQATFTELVRMRTFGFLFLFSLIVIGNSAFLARLSFTEEFQMLKDISLGAMSIFGAMLAIFGTASLIPKDVEDRTIYTILAKPVPRYEYLLGKLLGVLLLLGISVAVMFGVFVGVLLYREQVVLVQTAAEMSGMGQEEMEHALRQVRAAAFQPDLALAAVMIFVKSGVIAAMTLLIASFSTSGIYAMITATAVYFIGHLQAIARDYWIEQEVREWWVQGLLAVVALLFPDLQAFNLSDAVVAGTSIPMVVFWKTLGLGGAYVAVYAVLAFWIFSGREL